MTIAELATEISALEQGRAFPLEPEWDLPTTPLRRVETVDVGWPPHGSARTVEWEAAKEWRKNLPKPRPPRVYQKPHVYAVGCPACHALPSKPCRNSWGMTTISHTSRSMAALDEPVPPKQIVADRMLQPDDWERERWKNFQMRLMRKAEAKERKQKLSDFVTGIIAKIEAARRVRGVPPLMESA